MELDRRKPSEDRLSEHDVERIRGVFRSEIREFVHTSFEHLGLDMTTSSGRAEGHGLINWVRDAKAGTESAKNALIKGALGTIGTGLAYGIWVVVHSPVK